ncbi:MAG: ATP-dependent helicase/deoxyribonuclease subunit [Betaproteobacteria bacterium]|nr:ATP-dependent helicase/deoxyribonuclease subunit [Betaproteobacteria bacterium]
MLAKTTAGRLARPRFAEPRLTSFAAYKGGNSPFQAPPQPIFVSLPPDFPCQCLPPGPGFADAAADASLDVLAPRAGAVPGDFSAGLVLLPTLNAGPAMRAALARAAARGGLAVFLPPRLETLESWLARAPLQASVESRAARTAGLYRLLKARGWYGGDPPWETVRALLALADELSLHLHAAGDEPRLARAIESHYRAAAARVAGAEAQLVLEVWRAYAKPRPGAALDPGLARRMRQQAWQHAVAAHAPGAPTGIVWLTSCIEGALPAPELAFASALAAHMPLRLIAPQSLAPLLAAWEPKGAALAARAQSLTREQFETSRITVRAAHSLEQEATLAAAQVLQWLAAGKRRIAIVAFDRLTARRMRALLERRQVLLADESGWKLSTTSAATCAMRWVEAATGGFHQRDVLDWLKSPHVFASLPGAMRERAVACLEAAIREHNVLAGLPVMRKALYARSRRPDDEARDLAANLLERMDAAGRPWTRRSATLAEWCALLTSTLAELDAAGALQDDAAGKAVLDLLESLGAALEAPDAPRYAVTEWRAWLAAELETATFRDAAIDSPVVLTTLQAAVLREFDAVLLVGADAGHLPGEAAQGPLLTPRLRAELGLGTREDATRELRDELALVLAAAPVAAATWRASEAGDPNPLSPFLSRIDALYRAAGLAGLIVDSPRNAQAGVAQPAIAPAPAAPQLLPARVSVSAYSSLIVCPYQFFARHLLKLNEQDQVREEFEKRDYGEWVHRLLQRFHQKFPRITGVDRERLRDTLRALAEEEFAAPLEFNYLSLGWKLRWEGMAESYIEWQLEREAEGWNYSAGEKRGEIVVGLDGNEEDGQADGVVIHGRLDRIDTESAGKEVRRIEVLDYKTQSVDALRAKVKEAGEDVQLAVYALSQAEQGECSASFVSVDGEAVRTVPANPNHLPEDEWRRIAQLFGDLRGGAGMPANGIEAACNYCEMRGLCRRDIWAGTA